MSLYDAVLTQLETAKVPKDMLQIYSRLILDQRKEKTVSKSQFLQLKDAICRKFTIANLGYIHRRSMDLLDR